MVLYNLCRQERNQVSRKLEIWWFYINISSLLVNEYRSRLLLIYFYSKYEYLDMENTSDLSSYRCFHLGLGRKSMRYPESLNDQ